LLRFFICFREFLNYVFIPLPGHFTSPGIRNLAFIYRDVAKTRIAVGKIELQSRREDALRKKFRGLISKHIERVRLPNCIKEAQEKY